MTTLSDPAHNASKDPAAQFLEDLAVLCEGPAVDLHLALDGALIAMKTDDRLVWQASAESRWTRHDGRGRAVMLAGWLHEAAEKYRQLLPGRPGTIGMGAA